MAATIEVVLDCSDPDRSAEFWCAVLGYRRHGQVASYRSIVPADDGPGPKLILQGVDEPKAAKNRVHLDVWCDDLDAEVRRFEALGATRLDEVHEHGMRWIVLADPDGNEFCAVRTPAG